MTRAQYDFIARKVAIPLRARNYSPFDDAVIDDESETRVMPGEWIGRAGEVVVGDLTAAEAAVVITRQIHGFGGRLKKASRDFERAKKTALKLKK